MLQYRSAVHFFDLKKGLVGESGLPEDAPSSTSGIPRGCDVQRCGCDPSVCPDSPPGLSAQPPEAQTALKIPAGLPNVAVRGERGEVVV